MEFIEAPAFTRNVPAYLADEEYLRLQTRLAKNPTAGDLMPGTGGFRKLRWADPKRGKGRRGGLRISYYSFPAEEQIWLMTLYNKNEASDLTSQQKKSLRAALEAELAARESNRFVEKSKRSRP